MTLTPKRIEGIARELAARSDPDVTQAIRRYAPEEKIALRQAIEMQRQAQGINLDGAVEVPGRRFGEQNGSYWLRGEMIAAGKRPSAKRRPCSLSPL
jgi:hypothetical protein